MKKVNVMLSCAAVLFSVVGALATTGTRSVLAPVPVATNQSTCMQTGHCSNDSGTECKNSNGIQEYDRQSSSSCLVPALGTFSTP